MKNILMIGAVVVSLAIVAIGPMMFEKQVKRSGMWVSPRPALMTPAEAGELAKASVARF